MPISPRTRDILGILNGIPGNKIVSWEGMTCRSDFDMEDRRITTTTANTLDRLWKGNDVIGITVRQFTNEMRDGLPVKNLYGFLVVGESVRRLSPLDVERAQNTCDGHPPSSTSKDADE